MTQPFWDGCARGELLLQACQSCQAVWHPPSPLCPRCYSTDYAWTPVSGRGTIYTYSVVHRAFRPVWEPHLPYVVAIVELAEGPHMLSNLIGVAPDEVRIGMQVAVTFQPVSDTISVPLFEVVQ